MPKRNRGTLGMGRFASIDRPQRSGEPNTRSLTDTPSRPDAEVNPSTFSVPQTGRLMPAVSVDWRALSDEARTR